LGILKDKRVENKSTHTARTKNNTLNNISAISEEEMQRVNVCCVCTQCITSRG
jgi:hypothetical protein